MMQKKQYLKRLQWGPPGNEELLDELFRGFTVDGSTAFVGSCCPPLVSIVFRKYLMLIYRSVDFGDYLCYLLCQ